MTTALVRRFPRFRLRPPMTRLVPPDAPDRFPLLAADLEVVAAEVQPAFERNDARALIAQNTYRGLQVLIIAGGAAVAVLAALQAALPGTGAPAFVATAISATL